MVFNLNGGLAGNILSKLDESTKACDDMYSFACGKWLDQTETSGGNPINFGIIHDLIQLALRGM